MPSLQTTLAAITCTLAVGAPALAQMSITAIGPSGNNPRVSGNGTAVVGIPGGSRWTAAGGLEPPIPTQYNTSFANYSLVYTTGISHDGTAIIGKLGGWSISQNYQQQAFRWTQAGGYELIGWGNPRAVNHDAIAGDDVWDFPPTQIFSVNGWSTGGGGGHFGVSGQVTGVSGDGRTLLANRREFLSSPSLSGARYQPGFGWVDMGAGTVPISANYDGSMIIGSALFSGNNRPFLWTTEAGMQPLALPVGATGVANAISGSGGRIVGAANGLAALWTPDGYYNLRTYLESQGVNMAGWTLSTATSISADGNVIVGNGVLNGQSRTWIVNIPAPATTGLVFAAAFTCARRRRHR